jgi:hypothetical protein
MPSIAIEEESRKDRHVGLGIFAKYVLSTVRREDGFKKNPSQVSLSSVTSHPLSFG